MPSILQIPIPSLSMEMVMTVDLPQIKISPIIRAKTSIQMDSREQDIPSSDGQRAQYEPWYILILRAIRCELEMSSSMQSGSVIVANPTLHVPLPDVVSQQILPHQTKHGPMDHDHVDMTASMGIRVQPVVHHQLYQFEPAEMLMEEPTPLPTLPTLPILSVLQDQARTAHSQLHEIL
jgi:hypothetical protein